MTTGSFYLYGEKLVEGAIKSLSLKAENLGAFGHRLESGAVFMFQHLPDSYYNDSVVTIIVDSKEWNESEKSLRILCVSTIGSREHAIEIGRGTAERAIVRAVQVMLSRFCKGYDWEISEAVFD